MIELKEIKVKEKPKYVEPIEEETNTRQIMLIIALIFILIVNAFMVIDVVRNDRTIIEQKAEIERLQDKVYQQIELIDSLKQTIY